MDFLSITETIASINKEYNEVRKNGLTIENISNLEKRIDKFEKDYYDIVYFNNSFERNTRKQLRKVKFKKGLKKIFADKYNSFCWKKFLTFLLFIISTVIMIIIKKEGYRVHSDNDTVITVFAIIGGVLGLCCGGIGGLIGGGLIGALVGLIIKYLWIFVINNTVGTCLFVAFISFIGFLIGYAIDKKV